MKKEWMFPKSVWQKVLLPHGNRTSVTKNERRRIGRRKNSTNVVDKKPEEFDTMRVERKLVSQKFVEYVTFGNVIFGLVSTVFCGDIVLNTF